MTPPTPVTRATSRATPFGPWTARQVDIALQAAHAAPWPLPPNHDLPWQVQFTSAGMEFSFIADEPQAIGLNSHDALLACGAALCNTTIALRATGAYSDVRLFPTPARPGLVAVVRPAGTRPVGRADRELAAAIAGLRTLPDTVEPFPLPAAVLGRLRAAAEADRAWLAFPRPEDLAAWHASQPTTNTARADPNRTAPEPLTAVIGTLQDGLPSRVQAGQATQRVLLTAALAGLSATVAVASPRAELRALLGGGLWPHTVLRIGHAEPGVRFADLSRETRSC